MCARACGRGGALWGWGLAGGPRAAGAGGGGIASYFRSFITHGTHIRDAFTAMDLAFPHALAPEHDASLYPPVLYPRATAVVGIDCVYSLRQWSYMCVSWCVGVLSTIITRLVIEELRLPLLSNAFEALLFAA